MERLQHFYNQKYFTHNCPRPAVPEYLLFKSLKALEKAYQKQESQYLNNPYVTERLEGMEYIEKEFGYLMEEANMPK